MGQGRAVLAFRVIGLALQEQLDQGIAIGWQGLITKPVARLGQPMQQIGGAGGRIKAHPIRQAAVAGGVVG